MMRFRYLGAFAALWLSLPASVQAAGFLYDCDMTDAESSRGWISSKVALVVADDGTVQVVDGVVLHFNKKPMQTTVVRDNARRLIVKWSLDNARADNGHSFGDFDYRASVNKATGQIELTAIPRNFDTGVRSAGTCKKRSQ